jgi:hypothetical protein
VTGQSLDSNKTAWFLACRLARSSISSPLFTLVTGEAFGRGHGQTKIAFAVAKAATLRLAGFAGQ